MKTTRWFALNCALALAALPLIAHAQSFQQMPGNLAQVAVGNNGSVWGLTSAQQIYRWNIDLQKFDRKPGALAQIAVGMEGAAWGLNAAQEIYRFSPDAQAFVKITGRLAQIAVGNDAAVWGLNAAQEIYHYNCATQRFDRIPGYLKQISAGADGDVWGVNNAGAVYRYNVDSQLFIRVPGVLAQVKVGNAGAVWGLDFSGQPYRYDARLNGFQAVSGAFTQLVAGADGEVWGVNAAQMVYRWNPIRQTFLRVAGSVTTLAASDASGVWGVNAAQQIFVYRYANPLERLGQTRLLIVAPQAFQGAIQPLINHKNATGMPTNFISREALALYFQGGDDAERVKRGIAYAEAHLGTRYVMLAGDSAQMPVRYRNVRAMTTAGVTDGSFNPSDLYFANLYQNHFVLLGQIYNGGAFDTWDWNGNGRYDEMRWNPDDPNEVYNHNPDFVDGCPDIAVGRVPAHTAEEVTRYVNKIIRYETGQMSPALNRLTFLYDKNYNYNNGSYFFPNYEFIGLNYKEGEALPGGTFGNLGSFARALGDSFWLSYIGHGYNGGFGVQLKGASTLYDLNNALILGQINKYALPVVYSASCDTGQFAQCAPFGEYRDTAGVSRWLWWDDPKKTGGHLVKDIDTGQYWDSQATTPMPHNYDYAWATNRAFACSWLCGNKYEGGAIAYMGETVVLPNDTAKELESDILKQYIGGGRILGDIWLNGQRQYWLDNRTNGGLLRAPRIYLGIMTLFGDPSLRLLSIR
jgi:hypothetical protein